MEKYVCTACMWVYDPKENEDIPFEKLPDDYLCPICGAGKDMFEKQD
ncbi:MAG: rubredoxin [Candidatus Gastranaerophilales bacterium]|nr:rubredoxin [Candidatus Gastranaerophilales bacterium]